MPNTLFPSRDTTALAVAELESRLPITSRNELVAALSLYTNTVHNMANTEPYWNPDSHWEVHDDYTPKDWAHEVAENDTRQSYIGWVNSQIDGDREDVNAH